MATLGALMAAIVGWYSSGTRAERGLILDEFTLVAGIHRKHTMRLLRPTSLVGYGDRDRAAGFMARRCVWHWWCYGRLRIGFAANAFAR